MDEAQQFGGFLGDRDHTLYASHKWLLSGTPDNDNNRERLGAGGSCARLREHSVSLCSLEGGLLFAPAPS